MSYLAKSPKRVVGLYGCPAIQAPLAALLSSHAGDLDNQVLFQLIDSDQALTCFRKEPHQYPTYRPDGILKASWFTKHQERVCSCILVLFDWSAYIDRLSLETALVTQMDKVRNLTKARSPRLVLVLLSQPSVQQAVTDRGGKLELVGEGAGLDICPVPFAEQVGLLRKRLDLESRHIIILQGCNQLDLMEVATRTMRVVGECSTAYVLDEARHLKQHKGEVNRVTQPFLSARHQFKEGWFYEMLRDGPQALKHYQQAYEHVQASLGMYPPEEVRAVAEFIHDRIVTILLWWERDVRAALDAFNAHIRWYSAASVDASRLTITTSQAPWLKIIQETDRLLLAAAVGAQYERMADSLSSLNGAVAWTVPTSPGHFYQFAAETLRKHMQHHKSLQPMFQQVSGTYAAANIRPQFYDSGYLGKPPRVALKDASGADVELERKDLIFTFLRIYNEQEGGGYEDLLLNLLNKCLESYRLLYTPRLTAWISFEIAELLAARGEWARARKLLSDRMPDIVKEQWFGLGGRMLLLSVLCCGKLDDREAWMRLTLRAASSPVATADVRTQWLTALLAYVSGQEASPQEASPPPALALPPSPWEAGTEVLLPDNHPFLTVKAQFSEAVAQEHAPVMFRLFLTTKSPAPVSLHRLTVRFNDPAQSLAKATTEEAPLDLQPGGSLLLEFPMTAEDPVLLRCTEVVFELVPQPDGSPGLKLRWRCPVDAAMEERFEDEGTKYNWRFDVGFQDFMHRPLMRFTELQPKLTVEVSHAAPVLLGESFLFSLRLHANEDAVQGGEVTLSGLPGVVYWDGVDPTSTADDLTGPLTLPFAAIAAGGVLELPVGLQASRAGTCCLSLEVTYASELSPSLFVTQTLTLEVVYPFDVQVTFTDTLMWKKPKDARSPASCTPYRLPGRSVAFVERTNTYGGSPNSPLLPMSPTTDAAPNSHLPSSVRITPLSGDPGGDSYGFPTSCTFRKDQPIDVLVRLIATTPFPIVVRSLQLVPNAADQVSLLQASALPAEGEVLNPTEELEQAFCIACAVPSSLLGCGHLAVAAHRVGSDAPLTLTLPLPQLSVAAVPLVAAVECNTVAALGEVLPFKVRVRNTTPLMQAVTVRASDSRSFFWAGRASFSADIRPGQEAEFAYHLIPIQTGTVVLPPIDVQDQLAGVPVLLPTEKLSVFVYPKNRSSTPMA